MIRLHWDERTMQTALYVEDEDFKMSNTFTFALTHDEVCRLADAIGAEVLMHLVYGELKTREVNA